MKNKYKASLSVLIVFAIILFGITFSKKGSIEKTKKNIKPEAEYTTYLYNICIDTMNVEKHEIRRGETLSDILQQYNLSPSEIYKIAQSSNSVFNIKYIKAGQPYCIISSKDSLPQYMGYEINNTDWVRFQLTPPYSVKSGSKDIFYKKQIKYCKITSSLWNAMEKGNMPVMLISDLEDIFQWSVDFYHINKGDAFKLIYDEKYVDSTLIGTGTIYGAWFDHKGVKNYAIKYSYQKDSTHEINGYWDENGKNLKSMFLKAPLKYTRVSSRFSYHRYHPVLHKYRAHTGVDLAAPAGTPVRAIGDGTVIFRAYKGAGGNTIKIRHPNGYMSGYLHLSRYKRGLHVGQRVKQGEIIGYVGQTGRATGPHLDFRIWLHRKPLNPLKLSTNKGPDIAQAQKANYMIVRDSIMNLLQ